MCEALGTGVLQFDRERHKLYGIVRCGCGERTVRISPERGALGALEIDYEPDPDLRRNEQIVAAGGRGPRGPRAAGR